MENIVSSVPARLENTVRSFFRGWPDYITPIQETQELIDELYREGIPMYLLSNAPTFFAEWASGSETLKKFSGVIFSAPLKMAKPDSKIYRYLFETYSLKPEETLFIDDLKANVEAGRKLGMEGIIYTGDVSEIKAALGMI